MSDYPALAIIVFVTALATADGSSQESWPAEPISCQNVVDLEMTAIFTGDGFWPTATFRVEGTEQVRLVLRSHQAEQRTDPAAVDVEHFAPGGFYQMFATVQLTPDDSWRSELRCGGRVLAAMNQDGPIE
jgi:hypothetical protein